MKILYFDIVAIVILAILLASLFFRKMLNGRADKYLALLLANALVTAILDCWIEAYNVWIPVKESNTYIREILYYGYYLSRNLTPLLYQLFICAVTGTWHILKKNKWLKRGIQIPYLLVIGTLFTNLFQHTVFYFDENLVYIRGPLISLLYVASFLYFCFGIIYLFIYRKMLPADKFVASMLMYPMNLFAVAVQLVNSRYLIEMFMTSISLLLITIVVQRAEETVNPTLGIQNYVAYTTDLKKAFYIQKPMGIIYVKLVNYQALLGLLGYDACIQFMKRIATDLENISEQVHLSKDLYYLENGLFVFVTEEEEAEKLRKVAERVSVMLKQKKQFEQLKLRLDFCICILKCPQHIDNYESLLAFGHSFYTYLPRNTVNDMTETKDHSSLRLRNEISSIITNAIAEKRFEVYYQPIYSIKEKQFLSAEALIRLYDMNYGFISPELLITAAEKNGTILQIGDFIFEEVCHFLAKCQEKGLPIRYIELNLSMTQCMQKDLKEKVLYYLEKYHLRPDQINLEVTETAANTAPDIVEENMQSLLEQGSFFSLDDYGTGYSNISRIMSLPFHIVKLDKSLADKVDEPKIRTVLKHTILMLKEIGMEIVVEGVETKETLEEFAKMGCDFIQGYYFSKPLPEQEFVKFIQEAGKEV